jgi:hypothetical protein
MNRFTVSPAGGRGLLCLLLALSLLLAVPGSAPAAADPAHPVLLADSPGPLFAGWLQDVVGNRARLIQASFVAIAIGIFILWKK